MIKDKCDCDMVVWMGCLKSVKSPLYSIVEKRIFLVCESNGAVPLYRRDWFLEWVRLYFCKISITLIAKVALRVAKKDTKLKSDWYFQYPGYKDIYHEGYQWSSDVFCDMLRNLGPLLVGRGTKVLKDDVNQKHFSLWMNQR